MTIAYAILHTRYTAGDSKLDGPARVPPLASSFRDQAGRGQYVAYPGNSRLLTVIIGVKFSDGRDVVRLRGPSGLQERTMPTHPGVNPIFEMAAFTLAER